MKVSLGTVDVSDDARRAINNHYGRPGLATNEQVRSYARSAFDAAVDDLCYSLTSEEEVAASRREEAQS